MSVSVKANEIVDTNWSNLSCTTVKNITSCDGEKPFKKFIQQTETAVKKFSLTPTTLLLYHLKFPLKRRDGAATSKCNAHEFEFELS